MDTEGICWVRGKWPTSKAPYFEFPLTRLSLGRATQEDRGSEECDGEGAAKLLTLDEFPLPLPCRACVWRKERAVVGWRRLDLNLAGVISWLPAGRTGRIPRQIGPITSVAPPATAPTWSKLRIKATSPIRHRPIDFIAQTLSFSALLFPSIIY